jgi:hypothetical protein
VIMGARVHYELRGSALHRVNAVGASVDIAESSLRRVVDCYTGVVDRAYRKYILYKCNGQNISVHQISHF